MARRGKRVLAGALLAAAGHYWPVLSLLATAEVLHCWLPVGSPAGSNGLPLALSGPSGSGGTQRPLAVAQAKVAPARFTAPANKQLPEQPVRKLWPGRALGHGTRLHPLW